MVAIGLVVAAVFGTADAGGPFDPAVGSGYVGEFAHVTVSAHQRADGSAQGHMSFRPTGFRRVHADVTCLRVDGNEAIVGGVVRNPEEFFDVQGVTFFIRDNGRPGHGIPDELTPELAYFTANLCDLAPSFPFTPLTNGNLTVRDATP